MVTTQGDTMQTLAMIRDTTCACQAPVAPGRPADPLDDDLAHLEARIDARLRRERLRGAIARVATTAAVALTPFAGVLLAVRA